MARALLRPRTLGTLIALALLIYLLSQQGWREILVAIHQIPAWRLAAAFGLILISRFAVSGRWHVLLCAAKLKIAGRETIRITFAGLFASNFLPTTIGGDVVRLAGAVQLRYDAAICAASLIADRLVGMAGMLMTVPFGMHSLLMTLPGAATPAGIRTPWLLMSLAGVPNPDGESAGDGWSEKLRKWGNLLWRKLKLGLQRALGATQLWLKRPSSLLFSLGYSWINMLCLFGALTLVLDGLGETVPFWTIAGLYSLVYFVTLIPISINGYGVQELSMTLVFANLAGATIHHSLTTALLFRTLMMLASLPGAFFIPGILAARQDSGQRAGYSAQSDVALGSGASAPKPGASDAATQEDAVARNDA